MTTIRPDVAFTVNKLAQYMADPARFHQSAVKHLLRYLRSTKDTQICYGPETPNLIGYSDSDYGGDKSDRKSQKGNVFLLGGGAVSWLGRKQRSVNAPCQLQQLRQSTLPCPPVQSKVYGLRNYYGMWDMPSTSGKAPGLSICLGITNHH